MSNAEASHAAILVFDPVAANARTTRAMLRELGFSSVETICEFKAFAGAVARGGFDLVVAEAEAPDGDVAGLIQRLRGGEVGPNPFVAIILTCWRADEAFISHAIDTGADDVFLRPFSKSALSDRLNGLVRSRKDFVVTSDYIGPDRRKDARRPGGAATFKAPNTFKSAVEGDLSALHLAEAEIAQARADLDQERVKRLAMRVATAARMALEDLGAANVDDAEAVDRAARELRRRLRVCGRGEAVRLASALTDATAGLIEAAGQSEAKTYALVRDLALGAYAAFLGQDAANGAAAEIDTVLARLKTRAPAAA